MRLFCYLPFPKSHGSYTLVEGRLLVSRSQTLNSVWHQSLPLYHHDSLFVLQWRDCFSPVACFAFILIFVCLILLFTYLFIQQMFTERRLCGAQWARWAQSAGPQCPAVLVLTLNAWEGGWVEQSEATVFLQDRDQGGKQDEARLGTGVRRSGVGGNEGIPSKGSSWVQRPERLYKVFGEPVCELEMEW